MPCHVINKLGSRNFHPTGTLFNFLKWTSKLLELSLVNKPTPTPDFTTFLKSPTFKSLLNLHASLLETISNKTLSSNGSKITHLVSQSLKITRRFLLLGKIPACQVVLDIILTPSVLDGKEGCKHILLVGSVIDVVVHKGWINQVLDVKDRLTDLAKYFEKSVLSQKSTIPSVVAV